jgi:hypothetical protein
VDALADGGPRPVVLVLDYPGHRPEARLSELRLQEAGYDVRELLVRPLPRDLTAEAYATRALEQRNQSQEAKEAVEAPESVHAVLAYCMAAPLAQRVAAITSASHLLLFDAERPTPETIRNELQTVLRSFDPAAELPASFDDAELVRSPDTAMERIDAHLFSVIRAALAEDAGDTQGDTEDDPTVTQVARGLMGTYLDWLAHLVAASDAGTAAPGPPPITRAAHVTSAGHALPPDWPAMSDLPLHVVETGRKDLARAEATRAMTLRLLDPEHPVP